MVGKKSIIQKMLIQFTAWSEGIPYRCCFIAKSIQGEFNDVPMMLRLPPGLP
jgi:hypothetical protein